MVRRFQTLGLLLCLLAHINLGLVVASIDHEASTAAQSPKPKLPHTDLSIVGMPKAGTSQMYQLISNHRDAKAVRKEWCPNVEDLPRFARELNGRIWRYMLKDLGDAPRPTTLSACIDPSLALQYLKWVKETGAPMETTPKFIYLMRDPADWLWARFNFWTTGGDVEMHPPRYWTLKDNHRSPEYFQELLGAEGNIHGSFNVTRGYLEEQYKLGVLEQLMEEAGRENVMVINNEDLDKSDDAFMERLSTFTGLSIDGFPENVRHGRTNSGSTLHHRGFNQVRRHPPPPTAPGVYQISGFRPLLPKSRAFIYERAKSFCEELVAKYGIHFSRCLDNPSVAEEQQQEHAVAAAQDAP